MNCSKCDHYNPEDAIFCSQCDHLLICKVNICKCCGIPNSFEADSCDGCGEDLKPVAYTSPTGFQWFYRLFMPKNPRSWLEFAAVPDPEDNKTYWCHCYGNELWNLPNLEIVRVPGDLLSFAYQIIYYVAKYMKNVKPINSGENFGGMWVKNDQSAIHAATLHTVNRNDVDDPRLKEMLRIVDFGENLESGFPAKLFAAHLIESADFSNDPLEQARWAIAIYPGDPKAAKLDQPDNNEQNCWGWIVLGLYLYDGGNTQLAFRCYEEAIARCPSESKKFQDKMLQDIARNPALLNQSLFTFWRDADIDGIRAKVLERNET